jgi:hypothetical protein
MKTVIKAVIIICMSAVFVFGGEWEDRVMAGDDLYKDLRDECMR